MIESSFNVKAMYEAYQQVHKIEFEIHDPDDPIPWVYVLRNTVTSLIKVGISINPRRRCAKIQSSSGCETQLLFALQVEPEWNEPADRIEKFIHKYFSSFRRRGEWFDLDEYRLAELLWMMYTIDGYDAIINEEYYTPLGVELLDVL